MSTTLPAWLLETDPPDDYDAVDAFAEFDPAILASLRTLADEAALIAAVEVQLTTEVAVFEFPAQRRCARTSHTEPRAA